jgi:predicted GIY-YIG superfamily endonuclease
MPWFVYMIKSEMNGVLYKGVTENYERRLNEHNQGNSQYTSSLRPDIGVFRTNVFKRRCLNKREKIERATQKLS